MLYANLSRIISGTKDTPARSAKYRQCEKFVADNGLECSTSRTILDK